MNVSIKRKNEKKFRVVSIEAAAAEIQDADWSNMDGVDGIKFGLEGGDSSGENIYICDTHIVCLV